jgi:hypothetical protein
MQQIDFMALIPTWQVGTVFIMFCVLSAVATTRFIQQTSWFKRVTENTEFIGLIYPMIGAIYGVVLAFTIVLSWQRFADAEAHTASEATHLSSMYRNSQALRCDHQSLIEEHLTNYVQAVISCEWESLSSAGEGSSSAVLAYENIWSAYSQIEPVSYNAQRFYEAGVTQLNELGIQRRYRISSATAVISTVVWVFLCVGGILTIAIPMLVFTQSKKTQIALNGVMTFIIAFSLWIIAALQYPYSGDVSVSSEPFERVLMSFDERQKRDKRCPAASPVPVEKLSCGELSYE